jgi:hypothetical protein
LIKATTNITLPLFLVMLNVTIVVKDIVSKRNVKTQRMLNIVAQFL